MFIFFQICMTILTLKVYTVKNLKFLVGKTKKKHNCSNQRIGIKPINL